MTNKQVSKTIEVERSSSVGNRQPYSWYAENEQPAEQKKDVIHPDETITVIFDDLADLAWMIAGLAAAIRQSIDDANTHDLASLSSLQAILSKALFEKTFR
jgi:phenylpyruvate tautomerase PptA (4-oxalocrotonate tautomerase family)